MVVHGRVQGVFFRDACARRARAEGVVGTVRNRSDGTVHARFEGPADAVGRLVAWCREGPSHAEVAGVDVVEVSPTGLESFRIQ
ncbi:MAG TPA: acylphosphatase [Acidimicrobiales bacterium]|nr:acylphosphatase [Acidimicrobiales bacterium]